MIFCVEDDSGIRELVVYTLHSTGFAACGFCDATSFFAALDKEIPQLIVLDIMLPDMDGLFVLKRIRNNPKTQHIPVILATAKGTEYDKVIGLDSGADDYLPKPFGMMELVSRVKAVLRRSIPSAHNRQCLLWEGICLYPEEHRVTVNDVEVTLTPKEFQLLQSLMSQPARVHTREALLDSVWGYEQALESRTVDVHIRTLRQKLTLCGDCIETVRGVGYRMRQKRGEP